MLLSFVFVVMSITIYQERKTENALGALRDLSSPRALVIEMANRRGFQVARLCAAMSCSCRRATEYRPIPCCGP